MTTAPHLSPPATTVAGPAGWAADRPRRPGRWRRALPAYAFLTPWLLGLVIIVLGPMLASLYLSFTRYELIGEPEWIGLDNYVRMFTGDPRWLRSAKVTLVYVGLSVPLVLVFSLLLAMFLDKGIRLLSVYRALFYVPSLLGGSVAVAIVWRQVFGEDGIFNAAIGAFGVEHGSWVGDPTTALYTLVALNTWAFGATMVIFLAGLRQIPKEYYEAATLDGAGGWRRFRHITFPYLTPIIFFNGLLTIVHAFQSFTPAYIVSTGTGQPADSLLLYTLYLYQRGFVDFQMGYASAMAWLLLVVLAGITGVAFYSARYWVHYGEDS